MLTVPEGGAVSTVTPTAVDDALVFPAASVAVAVRECAPSVKVTVVLQEPAPLAIAVPFTVAPS